MVIKKILIANRGEIALRIIRACQELDIKTVAVHSTIDENAMHVRLADESVCIGPPLASKSYLNISSILSAAEVSGADAIHPGYGFLSENAKFAEIVNEHGLIFIGPKAQHISEMGDKVSARTAMKKLGIPLVPGSDGAIKNLQELKKIAKEIGFPILIKAASGGGGKGMKVAEKASELEEAWNLARSEAKSGFGDDTVYLERYLANPRHIEFQLFADSFGNVVHFGERDCSLQRRHQKVLEEAPSPALNEEERAKISKVIVKAVKKLGYLGAGTFEMLYENGEFFFIEMNTRIQVEHPITEMITGFDLVKEQINVANGKKLSVKQKDVKIKGHSIECRINSEDPETFIPNAGNIKNYHAPGGFGVRIDSALYSGYKVPPNYDSLIAKLIVYGNNREEAILKLKIALKEYVIDGINTTLSLHEKIISENEFISGNYDIRWLEKFLKNND
ncbi:MAG: acetyl-CoA carboxylase biotin carboxylase subunit [Pelagibacterales bacterium]|nr:acetyl-CoA carboxylase biotin carboxylase subunit [Pelagibacterales bacterium]OUV26022.1 MAG: acetyl-CoA carboxylase biotin carboxylase subunit [Alphaproteobacteria bacterium TMED109]RCL81115.1 MAG: acetyl-CoA carboxylase biotin carboxylase subunit [Alphaproteobacteria bacterium]